MIKFNFFTISLLIALLISSLSIAQDEIQQSLNGKSLPASGTLRVLVLFVEIDYDVRPNADPLDPKKGTELWPKGQLPKWKDDMFDPFPTESPKARMTRFFHDCSFGQLKIIGDYYDDVITIKESEINQPIQYHVLNKWVIKKVTEQGLKTHSNLGLKDFDLWTLTRNGMPKVTPSVDDPLKLDHVMVIYRNFAKQPSGTGRAAPGRFGNLFGFNTDSYSIFGAYSDLPFNMARHEFIHLVLGDNNFHAGGGQSYGTNYFIPQQGGWSILGAANSSLMICSAWDRDRLGWVGPNKKYSLSALDLFGKEVRTDLDGNNVEHEGIYVLRDFVSTGDALRVKLPGIRDNEYPQWIWIENHQTKAFNGSEFDTFQFAEAKCVDDPVPGIYAYMQVDKDIKEGSKLYSGYGDYIRPIPATGMYDFVFSEEKIPNRCINSKPMQSFARVPSLQNALTGNHMLEFPVGDLNGNGSISSKEGRIMAIEKIGKDEYVYRLPYLGHSDMAFTMDGNNEIGIGTNPSANNMYTLVSAEPGTRGGVLGKDGFGKPNNRIIFLNGVSIKILENLSGGKIKVEVKFNQTEISRNTRWCADSIVLPNIANAEYDLQIKNKSVLTLDQGLTATRIINPVEFDKEKIFASPTQLFAQQNTKILINEKSKVQVINGSKLAMLDNSVLVLDEESKLEIDKTSFLVLSNQSKIIVKGKSELIIRNKTLFEVLKELNVVEVESGKFRYCR